MATKTATKRAVLNVRVDPATKKAAHKVFATMGFDLSTGVNMYLARVVQEQGMPFTPRTVNGFTPEYEARILREAGHAKKYGKRYKSVEEMWKDI